MKTNATHPNKAFDEWDDLVNQEEAFYYHTINAFAALIVLYGYNKVIKDLKLKMKERP